jgi:hypothetical protein
MIHFKRKSSYTKTVNVSRDNIANDEIRLQNSSRDMEMHRLMEENDRLKALPVLCKDDKTFGQAHRLAKEVCYAKGTRY